MQTAVLNQTLSIPAPINNETEFTTQSPNAETGNVIKTVFLILLVGLNIIGNTSVCVVVLKDRQLRSTVRNSALASLSISDLLMIFIAVFRVLTLFGEGKDSINACDAFAKLFGILVYVSILHLFILSIDRYIAVFYPLHYRMMVTSRRMALVLTLVWLVPSFSVGVIPVLMGDSEEYIIRSIFFGCTDFVTHEIDSRLKIHMYLNAAFLFAVPLLCMIVAYIRIAKVTRDHSNRVDHVGNMSRRSGYSRLREMKWAKTVGMVIGAFIVCYLPIMVMVLHQVSNGPNQQAAEAISFLAYVDAVINPAIYTLRSREYRRAFTQICLHQSSDVTGNKPQGSHRASFHRNSMRTVNELTRESESEFTKNKTANSQRTCQLQLHFR